MRRVRGPTRARRSRKAEAPASQTPRSHPPPVLPPSPPTTPPRGEGRGRRLLRRPSPSFRPTGAVAPDSKTSSAEGPSPLGGVVGGDGGRTGGGCPAGREPPSPRAIPTRISRPSAAIPRKDRLARTA